MKLQGAAWIDEAKPPRARIGFDKTGATEHGVRMKKALDNMIDSQSSTFVN